jgi:hypothetical protein
MLLREIPDGLPESDAIFTDYAYKYRFVFVPEGSQAAYRSQDVFDFPVGSVIAKTFIIKADLRDPASAEEIIETRLLIRRKEGWARGYLDINCMHCHSPGGAADTSGMFLEYFRPFGYDTGECKKPVAAGGGGGGLDYDIVPGDAAASITHYRMNSNDTEVRMREIGRTIIHTEGVELIEQWIKAMEPNDCSES